MNYVVKLFFGVVLIFIMENVVAQSGEPLPGKATEILEGDIFIAQTVEDNPRTINLRIWGIDAPEEGQPYFEEAKKYLTELIGNKDVKVELLATDNMNIEVGKVWTEAGDNVSEIMIKEGYAWWDEENAKEDLTLKNLCATAIREKKGLWADTSPLAPWDYRKSKGLTQVSYKVQKEVEEKKEGKDDEKIVLKAKGNEVYKGTFSSNTPYVDVSKINFNETQIKPEELLMQHTPTIARDPAGNPIGLAVPNISQIPYAPALGFRDGDIVSSVNGIPINDFSQVMPLYERLKGTKDLSVQVIRGGKPVTLHFRLP
ncbi:MAG TPA: thermonuclease family protein [Candidatus Hydrogenedens sp.]|nr:thermonuclease family protein [Candidatus Hydrogenedens sp.]